MNNLTIWLLFMFICPSFVLLAYRFFGKEGLYTSIAMSIVIANIQVIKIIEIGGITITLGNILYGSIFLSTDILSEIYGKKSAKKGVMVGFFTMILAALYMQIAIMFKPSPEDFIQPHMIAMFSFMPRIIFASLIAYLLSQMHDVWAFNFCKKLTKGKHLWLRNNLSTIVSQLIDSLIFATIAFYGVFSLNVFWQILITTYILKLFISLFDTPFLYFAKYLIKDKIN
jgi:queuosine precursor transporter